MHEQIMNHRELVSVVIPAFNAARCVQRTIDSVLEQTHEPLEIIVVDDGSTDETSEIVAGYGGIVRLLNKENGGPSSARNAGIKVAEGGYIAFLDADDWWLPRKVASQVELLNRHPEIGFCSVATRVEDQEGNFLNMWSCTHWQGPFVEALFLNNAAVAGSASGVMVRRHVLEKAGLFDEKLASLEDIDMWMRLAAICRYTCIEELLAVVVKRPNSVSRNLDVMREAAIRVMKKNKPLLALRLQGMHWRNGLAGVYADYAKWSYRSGRRGAAFVDVVRALSLAPVARGRLCLGLLKDMILGRPL